MNFPVLFKALLAAEIMGFIWSLPGDGVAYRYVGVATGVFDEIFPTGQILLMSLWKGFHRFFTGQKEELGYPVYEIK
jgi:hypothetical protein